MTQDEAVAAVRADMLELNQHVLNALTKYDISAVSLAPHVGHETSARNLKATLACSLRLPVAL